MKLSKRIYNIPASCCFVDALAQKLEQEFDGHLLDLPEVLILLPNRRACKSLADAFVCRRGLSPTLLPRMMPIGDVDEDDLVLSSYEAGSALLEVKPAVERTERLMLFTKIIMARPTDYGVEKIGVAQACALAQELAGLIDTVHNEELDFANLQNLVPEEYAAHWQQTLKFLEIITTYWPQILQDRGVCDASERRRYLLQKQCEAWEKKPPQGRVIIAGSTATFPMMKRLVDIVCQLPQGEVILSGLDKELDEESWIEIDDTHPQFELKELLEYLHVDRGEVADLCPRVFAEREGLISEVMRPASTTDKWLMLKGRGVRFPAVEGIKLVDCADVRQEALSIALIMREVLETPEKTAALVTPDRNLARRVAGELERWNIKVDDSAGRPLSLTPVGCFLRLLLKACSQQAKRVDILSLLKHPLCGLGQKYGDVRASVRQVEQSVWRAGERGDDSDLLQCFAEKTAALRSLLQQSKVDLSVLIREHLQTAEVMAATEDKEGNALLWRGDAGEAASVFFSDWLEYAEILGEVEPFDYLGLSEVMMSGVMVRPKYGTHPRLRILGPIEARLTHFDVMILGEVNEGVWPQAVAGDPWMSRPMKRDFGFPQPEKSIGVLGLDFCNLLGAKDVYLTRAERVQGTPMVKSRWWMRLETVLKALDFDISLLFADKYPQIAQQLDFPDVFEKVEPPAPCPPVAARPRELSASGVELLMRDPYSVFAKYILRLKPLDDIEPDLTMADYGTMIHGILEEFNLLYPNAYPKNAKEILLALGKKRFAEDKLAVERRAFWWPKFEKAVEWLVAIEEEYRQTVKKVNSEVRGEMTIQAPAGPFKITAKADRIDETTDGRINVVDYKTGRARSSKEVEKGYAPQLPIEGLIAQKGGFFGIAAAAVADLIYWQLGKKMTNVNKNMEKILADNEENLQRLVAVFDFESTPYICHPNPKRIPEYSDYEHLARVKEWSVQSDDD